ncbi:hypothetical protein EYF80_021408 [Liparis tanakae]|uniref:Uncharacterized protein n=1 Tax=Liparis tanakae TaxID=230148 RepID=A0A4Z2HSU3_9TELE|nr:hypothetical protein EYF80_021408 [Liparis tanakae]
MGLGCWVSRRPKRFFTVTRWRENLSSGEKRAGWAELVGSPAGQIFCRRREKAKTLAFEGFGSPHEELEVVTVNKDCCRLLPRARVEDNGWTNTDTKQTSVLPAAGVVQDHQRIREAVQVVVPEVQDQWGALIRGGERRSAEKSNSI